MVRGAAAVLSRPRVLAFAINFVVVIAWFWVAPHLPYIGHAWNVALVSFLVLPGTMLLILWALPLWDRPWLWIATVVFALLALVFSLLDWGLPANFAKLFAAVCAGWTFLRLFEALSWVVLVALVIPLVDIVSVWRGPTHTITTHHFEVYTSVAIAFLAPAGSTAYLGPPDVLFYALFVGAAVRWNLRPVATWVVATLIYGLTIVLANATDAGGLPALPFLSIAFLLANGDLLWKQLRTRSS